MGRTGGTSHSSGVVGRSLKLAGFLLVQSVLVCVVGAAFWFQDWRYSLPAQPPPGWLSRSGSVVPPEVARLADGRPIALHFYSQGCPCSRFNLDHVRKLEAAYGRPVRFIVVMEGGGRSELRGDAEGLHLRAEQIYDESGAIARALGVYATPQAVILDRDLTVRFRGNYNVGRFCIDERTEFVRLALANIVAGRPTLPMPSVEPFGCVIPALENSGGDDASR